MTFMLEKAGAEVTIAENGKIGVELTQAAQHEQRPFDVVLMDMQMPVMDGYAATRALRAWDYTGPIIATTAHAMKDQLAKCIEAGCDGHITKPIDRGAMLETIARYLPSRATPVTVPADESPQYSLGY
jgi:CheY-like chemotaxis protein